MKKFFKIVFRLILIMFILLVLAYYILCNLDKWKASKKIKNIDKYAVSVDKIEVPENAKIIALGEATHGNKEFQELKLEVLKKLVKDNKVKSFALEADYGDGLIVNDYINGNSKLTKEEVVKSLSFDIYHTKQMLELIEWMKEYNLTAKEKLTFYGFDIQNIGNSIKYITNYLEENKTIQDFNVTNTLKPLTAENIKLSDESVKNSIEKLKEIKSQMDVNKAKYVDFEKYNSTYHALENVLSTVEYYSTADMTDYIAYNTMRDELMKANVDYILNLEMQKGNKAIMISGHNGHIAKEEINYTNMGNLLKSTYSADYYTIGTDYFNTNCNINSGATRENHKCNSADIMAYQAKYQDEKRYYLDFSKLEENTEIYNLIHGVISNGDLGEGYSIINTILPMSTRRKVVPANLYDSVIYVYSANPINII